MDTAQASPGRPRNQRTHQAILRATTKLIEEVGYAATSINAVAARAGVGKDTIYRRWSGKAELVYEAVFTTVDTAPVPDTGRMEADIAALSQALIAEFGAPAAAAALPGLLADFAADPALRRRVRPVLLASAKARLAEVVDRARSRGEIIGSVPVDLVLDMLAGTVFFHVGLLGEPPTPAMAEELARMATIGIGAR
ncbi:TetR/AcrR family transcriptional regulator [Nocardia sp. CNY236]|uniref:TetR/AcrR family transcriptional regulator n=1 Tax=Nocardia sp. CNY236 TaxID=1169152 RepID=UPI000411DDB6|nr:TetR/AcrR family transcriptional regulator [Nocardia sp. CNY236]